MLGDPGRGSKFWEALDPAISGSRKNCGEIVARREFLTCDSFPPPKESPSLKWPTTTSLPRWFDTKHVY
jgi:hypothetical protein